jgi:hypothetical protein
MWPLSEWSVHSQLLLFQVLSPNTKANS